MQRRLHLLVAVVNDLIDLLRNLREARGFKFHILHVLVPDHLGADEGLLVDLEYPL